MPDKKKYIEETETTTETTSKHFGTPETNQDVEYRKQTTVKREEKVEQEEQDDSTVIVGE